MTLRTIQRSDDAAIGSLDKLANQVRDNFGRLERMESTQPEALDFTADLVAAGAAPIHGVMSILCPAHIPESNWREAWRGLRDPGFIGLGRLGTSTRPEAKASLRAITERLARRLGMALVGVDGSEPIALGPAVGRVAKEVTDIVCRFTEAGSDVDASELEQIKREMREAEDAMQHLRVAIFQEESRR
jgi:hypothetical protein